LYGHGGHPDSGGRADPHSVHHGLIRHSERPGSARSLVALGFPGRSIVMDRRRIVRI